ncbi:hypothetical protein Asppvi_001873 [Aspergillus pseudoviridinutans]|uniref:Uncharacterized protein n=1 Tax=Aspergillus pseudoviridinutans TaxID=1517512 RepID=A0A9P3BNJ7_9EURO|nr:uncharacterized protein Asppvi_001873 [Aspergillus pseudoviridinutans]GIJ92595.1 hypothetical protein Asppvi_001873 [Aspergillus pseudoviridinutans]
MAYNQLPQGIKDKITTAFNEIVNVGAEALKDEDEAYLLLAGPNRIAIALSKGLGTEKGTKVVDDLFREGHWGCTGNAKKELLDELDRIYPVSPTNRAFQRPWNCTYTTSRFTGNEGLVVYVALAKYIVETQSSLTRGDYGKDLLNATVEKTKRTVPPTLPGPQPLQGDAAAQWIFDNEPQYVETVWAAFQRSVEELTMTNPTLHGTRDNRFGTYDYPKK